MHKNGRTKTQKDALPNESPTKSVVRETRECYMCSCPLFQPTPTCAFCNRGVCSDHLRKLRSYPHRPTDPSENTQLSNNFDMRPICDECQDMYILSELMEQPDFALEILAIADIESFLNKDDQKVLKKSSEVHAQLKAKQLKLEGLIARKNEGFGDIGTKQQEAAEQQAQIELDYAALEQFERLLEAANLELGVLQAQPFVSLQNDYTILTAESSKLTKDLLKLDKGLSDLKQNVKKLQKEMEVSYVKWQKRERQKKQKALNGQKQCVLF